MKALISQFITDTSRLPRKRPGHFRPHGHGVFPTLFGCRSAHELTRPRGWDKNWPWRNLEALTKRFWLQRLSKLGQDILTAMWRRVESMSEATKSRWQCTSVLDDTVFRTYGGLLELVGTWWSGQHKRVVHGIDGVLVLIVIGDGTLVVPVDCAVRRPYPKGPGARCRDTRTWARIMRDATLDALAQRGLELPPPIVVADSWCSDSTLMRHVADTHQGTLLVQGKATSTFYREDGRKVHGRDFIQDDDWSWQQRLHAPGCRSVRLQAKSPTYGVVTVIIVDKPGDDRLSLCCRATQVQVTRLLRT